MRRRSERKENPRRFVDLTSLLGIATPLGPTHQPLQVNYIKRLAPNGANG